MATTETRNAPDHDPARIKTDTIGHRAGLVRIFNELSKRIDVKKQTNRWWGQAKQRVANSAFVAADDARLAMARAQIASPRQWLTVLAPALGLMGAIVLILTTVHRRKK